MDNEEKDEKESRSISQFGQTPENPFLKECNFSVYPDKKIEKGARFKAANMDTGEEQELYVTERGLHIRDNSKFAKVYTDHAKMLRLLSSSGVGVLGFLFTVMQAGKDDVEIDTEDCMEFNEWKSRTTVYNGIYELLKHRYLGRRVGIGGKYWINLNMIFNGSRIKLMDRIERAKPPKKLKR